MRWLALGHSSACLFLLAPIAATEPPAVRLAALGDVLLARSVLPRIAEHGPDWLWSRLPAEWAAADMRFANLEGSLTGRGVPADKPYLFRCDPAVALPVLQAGGLSVLSLANNHSADYGADGLADTLAAVAEAGAAPLGAGRGRAAALAPKTIERAGLRIAFVAYTAFAADDRPIAEHDTQAALLVEETLPDELRAARAEADLLVLSLHWGIEESYYPTPEQVELAHAAIDAGADLVLGHGPHVAQPVEIYRDRPIVYSLGNAAFDRTDPQWGNGLMVLVRLERGRVTIERQVTLHQVETRPVPVEQG